MNALPADPADLSEDQLKQLILTAQKTLAQRQTERARVTLKELRQRAAEVGYQATFTKLGKPAAGKPSVPPPDSRKQVAAKYRNPADPRETWAGRGRPPKWVQVALAEGGSLEDLAIPPSAAAE